jgi:asparagine synthase (glutamine-hydrolysing)
MCGLAGIFSYAAQSPPIQLESLLSIRDNMQSRGPDGEGLWISDDQCIGLAHRRLSIIDLSEDGAQPMIDPDTGNRIVFNGEIYNYQALRTNLTAAGHRFRSHSDTEVLLKLYAVHGQQMLHLLRGMFAFTIWDQRKRAVFIARDPFGIKPMYLADDGQTLRFASQVKALLAGGGIDTSPEAAGHVGFFLLGSVPEPFTLYKGIRALPAGHSLWLEAGGRRSQQSYFDLAEAYAQPAMTDALTGDEAREQLREALRDSVRHHLVADVPVGVFLSAGLDSTTVAALAKESGVAELNTLTLGFREFSGTDNDEVPLAEAVSKHLGALHHTQWVGRDDFAEHFEQLLAAMDQPSIDGVNSYFVAKAAHDAGLKAALSGLGGDELFAGYIDFRTIPRMVRCLRPLSLIPGLGRGFRFISSPIIKRLTSPKTAGLLEYGGDYAGAYLLRRGLFMPWELPEVLDGDLVRQGWRDLQLLPALRRSIQSVEGEREKVSLLETAWYMRNQLLRDTDWASMAHSLEVRVPLVDLSLARTVARLSCAGFAPDKQAMADAPLVKLPAAVRNRRKTGFSVPVHDWLLQKPNRHVEAVPRGLRGWAVQMHRQFGSVAV